MGETTKIQWADASWSPWHGCTKVAPECANCYAAKDAPRNPQTLGIWGPSGRRVVAAESSWKRVQSWNRKAERDGVWLRVFPSICDPFEAWDGPMITHDGDEVRKCVACGWQGTLPLIMRTGGPQKSLYDCPQCGKPSQLATMQDVREWFFRLIDSTPNIDWLLLTKRPENIREMWPNRETVAIAGPGLEYQDRVSYRKNVWLLASAGSQATLDKFAPALQQCRDLCPVIGYSAEPLLEATDYRLSEYPVDWIIAGGESGPKARSCDVEWIRSILDQCKVSGTACFVKQLGAKPFMGVKGFGPVIRHPKGGEMAEWPRDLCVRETPA